ncbi:uncharacterized protein LOC62_03G003992 [Vanrija pseudolonga]|uniref:Uncharacterized protein n=1 Tax=Vanrija pseudolonga TaxID=143232 RepID=A0AAF0Y5I8_9TREE|nr:hypothetical protein LOC62_03G003992 [Vanrija pseudolonga]
MSYNADNASYWGPHWVNYEWTGRTPGTHDSHDSDSDVTNTGEENYDEHVNELSAASGTDDDALATPRGSWLMLRGAYTLVAEPLAAVDEESDTDTTHGPVPSPPTSTYDADFDSASDSENDALSPPPAADWANEEYGYGYHTDRNPYDYTDDGSSDYSPTDDSSSDSGISNLRYGGDYSSSGETDGTGGSRC